MPSNDQSPRSSTGKWLSIVGIGEDGVAGLGESARNAIAGASTVFGGKRHLALAKSLIAGEAVAWPTPFDAAMEAVLAYRGTPVCVLASGDPFLHGVGTTLCRRVPIGEISVHPHASAFSLAAARMGWALNDCDAISLHGRDIRHIRPLLQPGSRILALTSDESGPAQIADFLTRTGFEKSKMHVLEALGGASEQIRQVNAGRFDLTDIHPLNLVALEIEAGVEAAILPLSTGLADELFCHDGQMTKREVRAMTMSALAPCKGELLWDIGAGAGSVSIEWMLRHPSMRAVAIEKGKTRADRIARNADEFGVPGIRIIRGTAPDALSGLEQPDAIFVGGGGSDPDVMTTAIDAVRSGGRVVVNAVTLEMEAVLLRLHRKTGGELSRIALSRASAVGSMTGWRTAMPVTQWTWVRP